MRKELKKFLDQKAQLTGHLERYGLKNEYIGGQTITLLLTDIELINQEGKMIKLDHAWLKVGKTLAKLNAAEGSVLTMNCHIKEYTKGYVNYRDYVDERHTDYGIQRASSIKIKENSQGETFKEFYNRSKNTHFLSNKYEEIV